MLSNANSGVYVALTSVFKNIKYNQGVRHGVTVEYNM